MNDVRLKYRICKLENVYNDVELTLQESFNAKLPPPPPPKLDREEPNINLEKIINQSPVATSDDERVVENYMKAVKKMAPNMSKFLEEMGKASKPGGMTPLVSMKKLSSVIMILSRENYLKLGSTSLSDIVEIKLEILRERR